MKIVLIIVGLFLVGCNGFNQDPYKGKNDLVNTAIDPAGKPSAPKPIDANYYTFTWSEVTAINEGEQLSIDFTLNGFNPNYDFSYEITNLADFKDAQFDAAKNAFTWTPIKGDFNYADSQVVRKINLLIQINAKLRDVSVSSVPLQSEESINIDVYRVRSVPEITQANSTSSNLNIIEDSYNYFNLKIFDPESSSDQSTKPEIEFDGLFAPYVRAESYDNPTYDINTKTWDYKYFINLYSKELTTSMSNADLFIRASNAVGTSKRVLIPYKILTKFGDVKNNLKKATQLKLGILNKVQFNIFDSKNEAIVKYTNSTNLPAGSQITCEVVNITFQQCEFLWMPTDVDVGKTFYPTLDVELRSTNAADTRVIKASTSIQFSVVAQ